MADWQEFQSRFGVGTPRRLWLFGRFQALVELAASTGQLRRVFIWGSFVTIKPVPRDVDTLPIMDEDFEVERVPVPARVLFDSIHSKLLAGHLSDFQKLWKTRYCRTGVAMIQTDDQMLLAQQCIGNLRRVLLEARRVHSRQDYARLAEPILLEIQAREREILEYLSRDLEQLVTI